MYNQEEKVLDKDQWITEAQAVIKDIGNHVKHINISGKLTSSNNCIYLNLTTLEDSQFCIKLSKEGFKVIGKQHDDNSNNDNEIFETPYSLLNFISPKYKESFGSELLDKLNNLNNST